MDKIVIVFLWVISGPNNDFFPEGKVITVDMMEVHVDSAKRCEEVYTSNEQSLTNSMLAGNPGPLHLEHLCLEVSRPRKEANK